MWFLILFDNKFIQISFILWGTMLFLLIMILYNNSFLLIFQYFLLQEFRGFHYLLRFSLGFQFLILMLKGGFSPFFYWSLIFGVKLIKLRFSWFISFQKLFILILLSFILNRLFIFFLIFSIFLVFLIYWLNYNYKFLLILSRVESIGWLLIIFFNNLLSLIFIILYLIIIYFFSISLNNLDFLLSLTSFPFRVPFLLKFFSILTLSHRVGLFQFTLIAMTFISVMSLSVILILFLLYNKKKLLNFFALVVITTPLILILYFGYCKKHTSLIKKRSLWAKIIG